jgi:hypothetical protein
VSKASLREWHKSGFLKQPLRNLTIERKVSETVCWKKRPLPVKRVHFPQGQNNFDYCFTEQLCAVAFIAYNYFYSGSASINDTYWWNISLNVKYKFTSNPLSPYIDGGLGVYIPKERSTNKKFFFQYFEKNRE